MLGKRTQFILGLFIGISIITGPLFVYAQATAPSTGTTTKTTTTSTSTKKTTASTAPANFCIDGKVQVIDSSKNIQVCKTTGQVINYVCREGGGSTAAPSCSVGGFFGGGTSTADLECACCGNCPLSSIVGTGVQISKWVLGFTGSAALAVFIWGGILWLTSGGNPEQIKKGRTALTSATIGVIIVLSAWLIVNQTLIALTGDGIDKIQSEYKADKP